VKTLLTLAFLLLGAHSVTAQGTILFQNYPNMDLVRFPDGRPIPAGEGWMAELLAGADPLSLWPTGITTTFKLPGVFGLGDSPVVLPGRPTGFQPCLQVLYWQSQDGTIGSYAQALEAGVSCGSLPIFYLSEGLGAADGDPPAPPLWGFSTWDVGGWIYLDLVGNDAVIHWGKWTALLGILHFELAEAVDLEGPWTVISDAEIPYRAPAVGAGHRFFRTIPVP
jgi:hypothetical protein